MKLDPNVLRYLTKDDFRVLTAIEMGQKNHEIVPVPLVDSISGIKHGGAFKCIKTLLRHKLVHHENVRYDGYRLTPLGYDFLAIRVLVARGHISGVGRQIGVGKESDIHEVMNDEGEIFALKLHRLGRTSFRAVKSKRDYLGSRSSASWLYLSRLSALKEYAFMRALGDHGFPVPMAIDHNRHAVLMTLIPGIPLVQIRQLESPGTIYALCMNLISRLATKGLIHCDFNEFNLLVDDDEVVTLIDFPQMVSVGHANAKELFERDVECIHRFFTKKIGYVPEQDPDLPCVRPVFEEVAAAAADSCGALDVELAASGFKRTHQAELERMGVAGRGHEDDNAGGDDGSDDEEGEDSEESTDSAVEEAALADVERQPDEDETTEPHRTAEDVQACSKSFGEEDKLDEAAEELKGLCSSSEPETEEPEASEQGFSRSGNNRSRKQQQGAALKVRDVQHMLVAERKKSARREAVVRASRNMTKSKGRKGSEKADSIW